MFRPVPMMRLNAVILERDERGVLRDLGQRGAMQLTCTRSGPDSAPLPPRDRSRELAQCDCLLANIEELRRSLEIKPAAATIEEKTGMTLDEAGCEIRLIEERAAGLLKRRQQLLQRADELAASCERVSRYKGLEIPLDRQEQTEFLHFVTGTMPADNLEDLQNKIGDNVALLPLPADKGRLALMAMTTRRVRPALERILADAGFQHDSLPVVEGATTDSLFDKSRREREQVLAELEQLNAELRPFVTEVADRLTTIEQAAVTERRLLEAEQNFSRTAAAVLLTGWVPATDTSVVQARLKKITGGRCVAEMEAPENLPEEQVPVLLRHPRWLRPFEMLVTAYGLPRYQELEPTLFVAVSYVLMFGMMFGDAGHGCVLAAGGLAALLAGGTARSRDVGLLLLFCGISSITFGILYGSWFGLPALKKHALWHDPLEGDPMGLMYGAMGIGILMISLGLVLNIINRFRHGDVIGGFLDKSGVVGALFYCGALMLITQSATLHARGLIHWAVMLFLVVPLMGWALKEPLEYVLNRRTSHPTEPGGNLFSAITEALVGAFEAVLSYLANTISFVRLAAYAMSHAALLLATFMLAAEVRNTSGGGGLFSVMVIILGNLVAILLEGIVASVQALRLEYYEFFGKFFSGSGRPFQPFCLTANQA